MAVRVRSSFLRNHPSSFIPPVILPVSYTPDTIFRDVQLYKDVELFPGSSTQQHLFTQHGLRVNGPLYTNPAEGPACLLVATKASGQPAIVKMLSNTKDEQQPGGPEAATCRQVHWVLCRRADSPAISVSGYFCSICKILSLAPLCLVIYVELSDIAWLPLLLRTVLGLCTRTCLRARR